jgi:hypothetical protein
MIYIKGARLLNRHLFLLKILKKKITVIKHETLISQIAQ